MRRLDRPLTHDWIWRAIDTLARRNSYTPSGLARLAGLDPTAFNRSKRLTPEGRPRWPSTESIAKILEATKTSLDEFATLEWDASLEVSFDEREEGEITGIPLVGSVQDAAVRDWEPPGGCASLGPGRSIAPAGRRRFAVAVGDSSLEPVYSVGNTLVVSEAAEPRTGDRVLVKPAGMPVLPRLLVASSPARIEFGSLQGKGERIAVPRQDISWIARIVLVRQ